jgi:hypothetical protein
MTLNETEKYLRADYPDMPQSEIIRAAAAIDRTGLSYVDRHVYATPRRQGGRDTLVVFAGIDGLRLAATATGQYAGCIRHDPEMAVDADGEMFPKSIRATARRRLETGEIAEFSVQVFLAEYEVRSKAQDGGLWITKPVTMLGKVAESQAIRMAFPDRFSQVYEPGEFPEPEPERQESRKPVPVARAQTAEPVAPPDDLTPTAMQAWWAAMSEEDWFRCRNSSTVLANWRRDDPSKPALEWAGINPRTKGIILGCARDGGFGPTGGE